MKRFFYISISTVFFFAIALLYEHFSEKDLLENYQSAITSHLHEREIKVKDLAESLSGNIPDASLREQLIQEDFSIFLYQEDSLIFWNKNEVFLSPEKFQELKTKKYPWFTELSNGWFEVNGYAFKSNSGNRFLLSAIPLKRSFSSDSPYLPGQFSGLTHIPSSIAISTKPTDIALQTHLGEILCYLNTSNKINSTHQQLIAFFLYFFALLSLLILVHYTAKHLAISNLWLGTFLLLFVVSCLVILNNSFGFFQKFSGLQAFSKEINSPFLSHTPGELLINSLLLLWLVVFFNQHFKLKENLKLKNSYAILISTGSYFAVIIGLLALTRFFKSLILESGIVFNFSNVFNLNTHSFIALIASTLMILAFFLFSHRMIHSVSSISKSPNQRITALIIAMLIALPLISMIDISLSLFTFSVMTFFYILFFDFIKERAFATMTFRFIWLSVFSLYAAVLLDTYNIQKDELLQLEYAKILAEKKDALVEPALFGLSNKLKKDSLFNEYLALPSSSTLKSQAINKLIDQYFIEDDYLFHNYKYDAFITQSSSNKSLIEESSIPLLIQVIETSNYAITTTYPDLFLWEENQYPYSYLLQWETAISVAPGESKDFFLCLSPSRKKESNLYAELKINSDYKGLKNIHDYHYGVFYGNRPNFIHGNLNETLLNSRDEVESGSSKSVFSKTYNGLVYKKADHTTVLIGKELGGTIRPLPLFSYMFGLLLLSSLLFAILNYFTKSLPDIPVFYLQGSSLRNRIQYFVVLLILFSFVLIGFTTVTFFRRDSIETQNDRLSIITQSIMEDIKRDVQLISNLKDTVDLTTIAGPVASIHNMDIHLYDTDGYLITSSDSFALHKKIISPRMNARAYDALAHQNKPAIFLNEKLGDLNYTATYLPLSFKENKTDAYLGLPYYSQDRIQQSGVITFMGSLLNVYVFLLIVAGVLAIGVSNSITRPISRIGEKIKSFKFGQNEPLEWKSRDELGELINEYNKMIAALDESAEKLKQSEREGAWRDMAQQVAHEIKNPLTPMKLSLQHFMRVYEERPEKAKALWDKVSKTIMDQIDILTRIASEFSHFAKMPRAQNEVLHINDLVNSVYNLFTENPENDCEMSLNLPEKDYQVNADKDHLIRVFNNLLKNATQAIPPERTGEIALDIYQKGANIVASVKDNGSGIPEDMQARVFYPKVTSKASGMGLGLAMCKNIINALDGKIYFETEEGIGTTFFVEVPLYENEG